MTKVVPFPSFCRLLTNCRSLSSLGMTIRGILRARRFDLQPELFAKFFEIDAAIEAQTEEETFFDCCLRGDGRYGMRLAIHVGVERVWGCEADGLGTVGLDAVDGCREFRVAVAAGSSRASLGWTAEGGCPYADWRGRPSPHERL